MLWVWWVTNYRQALEPRFPSPILIKVDSAVSDFLKSQHNNNNEFYGMEKISLSRVHAQRSNVDIAAKKCIFLQCFMAFSKAVVYAPLHSWSHFLWGEIKYYIICSLITPLLWQIQILILHILDKEYAQNPWLVPKYQATFSKAYYMTEEKR